jgi:hypothetical protein
MYLPVRRLSLVFLIAATASTNLACGAKEYVRGVNAPEVDDPAMSTGLDKADVQHMVAENLNHLRNSPLMDGWRVVQPRPTVAIFPFRNETSEHIDAQLDAVLSEAETWLVESDTVTVISRERQREMIDETEREAEPPFDPALATRFGRQLGARYYITGKIMASDERASDAHRVQYLCYMQVIETDTGVIRWQRRAYATKMAR